MFIFQKSKQQDEKGISKNYLWPEIFSDASKYINEREICEKNKNSQKQKIGFMGKRIIRESCSVFSADIIAPLPLSKNKN